MIHCVHDRPSMKLKAYDESGTLLLAIDASGDAWGDGSSGPYGHDYPIPPGHYVLGAAQQWATFDPAEGWGQIPVLDIDPVVLAALVKSSKAQQHGPAVTVGGIALPIGQLAAHGRAGIMVHGGGSNLGMPAAEADFQQLCKTEGCTRVHNADWKTLAAKVDGWLAGNVIVWSVVGEPAPLSI